MRGVIKYFLPDRHFGFIKYASSAGSCRLDREAYFADTSLSVFVEKGDQVEFDLEPTDDGRERAINIKSVIGRLNGTVVRVGRKSFCYLSVDGRHGDDQQIFAAFDSVVPDKIGRRALPVGARVSFRLEIQQIKGECIGRERAVDVKNEDAESSSSMDASTYREFGKVEWYDGDRGHIRRPSGDTVAFLKKNVVTEGVETIAPGIWLQYGIQVNRFLWSDADQNFRHRVYCRDIAVCLGDASSDSQPILPIECVERGSVEAFFMNAPELELDEPKPESLEPGHVYLPSERKLSLKEIIARRSLV